MSDQVNPTNDQTEEVKPAEENTTAPEATVEVSSTPEK